MAAFMLNRRIRQLIQSKGITQAKLAEEIELEPGYISELLNGHPDKRWNINHIASICKALKVDPWQLFVDPKDVLPPEYNELMNGYLSLDDDRRRMVDDAIAAAKYRAESGEKKRSGPQEGVHNGDKSPAHGKRHT